MHRRRKQAKSTVNSEPPENASTKPFVSESPVSGKGGPSVRCLIPNGSFAVALRRNRLLSVPNAMKLEHRIAFRQLGL